MLWTLPVCFKRPGGMRTSGEAKAMLEDAHGAIAAADRQRLTPEPPSAGTSANRLLVSEVCTLLEPSSLVEMRFNFDR